MNILGFGAAEILFILFLLLLFFGKSRLPGLARSMGESFRELKNSLIAIVDNKPDDETPPSPDKTKDGKKS